MAALACSQAQPPIPATGPSFIELRLPAGLGPMRRDPVSFDHARHAKAMEKEGCKTCHATKEGLSNRLEGVDFDSHDAQEIQNGYHQVCIGCHKAKAASLDGKPLPRACGECHRPGPGTPYPGWSPVRFDSSLHARHVLALDDGSGAKEQPCKTCHGMLNPKTGKREYVKGLEGPCTDCHGSAPVEHRPSLRQASHKLCVSCHFELAGQGRKAGPTACEGCHDAEARARIKILPKQEIPRLLTKQKDKYLLHTDGVSSKAVPFDHERHERSTRFCTDCHHRTQKACSTCHTPTGLSEGGDITLVQAFHDRDSTWSCTGCHEAESRKGDCAGCHEDKPIEESKSTCDRCHTGKPAPETPGLEPLPAVSDTFPEKVELKVLADRYGPSVVPHLKMVSRLDAAARKSVLASYFHGTTAVLCSGCHHRSPPGTKPPQCRSCHVLRDGLEAKTPATDSREDRPNLRAAYHRQCLGCHQKIDLDKTGCTDCHALARKEVGP